jgi:ribonuclease E
MVECLGRDRTKHQVAEVTSLGLVQMTRKRMGTGLLEVFGEQCETCAGRGIVTHDEPVEHRRANTVAAEHYVPRTEAQPAARPERKSRRRGRGGQGPEAAPAAPAAVHAEPTEAERHAKAEATRAALANIAAAAHAAHLHDGEAAAASDAGARQAAVDAVTQLAAADEAAGRPATVLTFGGEQVALPFVEHAEDAPSPALTLDLLTEAFANLGDAEAGKQDELQAAAQAPASAAPEAPAAVRAAEAPAARAADTTTRGRRGRRNRSASRAQGAANETSVEHREATRPAAAGSVHEAKAPAAARPASMPAGNEPIILGVGVPASEL